MRPACSQISTPSAAHGGRARIEKPCGGWRKRHGSLDASLHSRRREMRQSRQFRLSLMNPDSASLTIVLRQSHNRAPKILEFVPVSPSSTARHPVSTIPTQSHELPFGRLTIALHESRNRAPKFLEFRQNFNCSRRRPPPQSRPRSADLSGILTAERPGKSDASERRPAIKREKFPDSVRPPQNVR